MEHTDLDMTKTKVLVKYGYVVWDNNGCLRKTKQLQAFLKMLDND